VDPVPAPERILSAVADLSKSSGEAFEVSNEPVTGTRLYVVFARNHRLGEAYTRAKGVLGFRVPDTYPDAQPEDSFFILPADIKLKVPDPVRNSSDLHRAGASGPEYLGGTVLAGESALVFSWHLWDRSPWSRSKHSLIDHYHHSLRRFEQLEHD
jgi:hypothetical protein